MVKKFRQGSPESFPQEKLNNINSDNDNSDNIHCEFYFTFYFFCFFYIYLNVFMLFVDFNTGNSPAW